MIDKLVHFEFEELDDDFLQSLRKEIPKMLVSLLMLKLVNDIPYNFKGGDAEKEVKLYHDVLKEKTDMHTIGLP